MDYDFILGYADTLTKLGFHIDLNKPETIDLVKESAFAPGKASSLFSMLSGKGRNIGGVPRPGGAGIKQKLKSGFEFATKGTRVKTPGPPAVPKAAKLPVIKPPKAAKPPQPEIPIVSEASQKGGLSFKSKALLGAGGLGGSAYLMNQGQPQQQQMRPYYGDMSGYSRGY